MITKLKRLNKQRILLIAIVLIILLVGVIATVFIMNRKDANTNTSKDLKLGQTSISGSDYEAIKDEASKNQISSDQVADEVQLYLRYKEAARLLKINVPDFFLKTQLSQNGDIYQTDLTTYDRVHLYPRALGIVLSLISEGGSIATVYHAPYASADHKEDAQLFTQSAEGFTKNTSSDNQKVADPIHVTVATFQSTEFFNFADGVNKSGVYALSNNCQQLTYNESTNDPKITTPLMTNVAKTVFDTSLCDLVKKTANQKFSASTELSNPQAYATIYKDISYAKNDSIAQQFTDTLSKVGNVNE